MQDNAKTTEPHIFTVRRDGDVPGKNVLHFSMDQDKRGRSIHFLKKSL